MTTQSITAWGSEGMSGGHLLHPPIQCRALATVPLTESWKPPNAVNLYLSSNPVHPRWQIYLNIQSAAPKPQHGAAGPCCTRCHYQEELQNSSCWQFSFKNLRRFPEEPLLSPFQLLLGSYRCLGLHSTRAALRWSLPQFFHSLRWGSQLWTHSSRQHSSHAWSEHTVTLISHSSYACLLYSFLSPTSGITPAHKHTCEFIIRSPF